MLSEGIESDQWHEMGYDGAPESPFFLKCWKYLCCKVAGQQIELYKRNEIRMVPL